MTYEKHWLERVDAMIRKSKQQVYVDIGDICDDIMVSFFLIQNKFFLKKVNVPTSVMVC